VSAVAPGSALKDRYRLDDRIAVGGMGEVWRGTDLALARAVAIKLLRPEYLQDEECLARFRAEGRHTASLTHPNIAQVYDYFDPVPPDPGFLVLELVDGQSLARLLDSGPLDPARAMGIIAQAAAGLQAAHAAGVVHRDIKPGNLLVGHHDQVKITDFGVAQLAGAARVTRTGALVGTPAYLAPERAAGGPATPAGDLYALGIVAHHCLTGQVPFDGEPLAVAVAHMHRDMPPLPPSVPAGVAALVTDLTAKDPSARPASAKDVAARAEQLQSAPSRPPGGGARPRWRRLSLAGIPARAALVIAALVLASLGWALVTHGSAPAQGRSPGTHPASPQADVHGTAGPGPVASSGPSGTGGAPQARSHPSQSGRPSPSPSPAASPTPSAPTPTPSAPSPTPSPPPTTTPTPTPSCTINVLGITVCT
jgi:eukaryotic-like serine/threonine-protein kinase